MAHSKGLTLAPWGVLGGGKIQTNAKEACCKESSKKGHTLFSTKWECMPEQKKVYVCLEVLAC